MFASTASSIRDLNRNDRVSLTQVLKKKPEEDIQTFSSRVATQISTLPSHLKKPKYFPKSLQSEHTHAPLCNIHKSLNARVIQSIFEHVTHEVGSRCNSLVAIGDKVEAPLRSQLLHLRFMHSMWLTPQAYEQTFFQDPKPYWPYQKDQCEACMLTRIGSSRDALGRLRMALLSRTRELSATPEHRGIPRLLPFVDEWILWEPKDIAKMLIEKSGIWGKTLKSYRKDIWNERRSRRGLSRMPSPNASTSDSDPSRTTGSHNLQSNSQNAFADPPRTLGEMDKDFAEDSDFESKIISDYLPCHDIKQPLSETTTVNGDAEEMCGPFEEITPHHQSKEKKQNDYRYPGETTPKPAMLNKDHGMSYGSDEDADYEPPRRSWQHSDPFADAPQTARLVRQHSAPTPVSPTEESSTAINRSSRADSWASVYTFNEYDESDPAYKDAREIWNDMREQTLYNPENSAAIFGPQSNISLPYVPPPLHVQKTGADSAEPEMRATLHRPHSSLERVPSQLRSGRRFPSQSPSTQQQTTHHLNSSSVFFDGPPPPSTSNLALAGSGDHAPPPMPRAHSASGPHVTAEERASAYRNSLIAFPVSPVSPQYDGTKTPQTAYCESMISPKTVPNPKPKKSGTRSTTAASTTAARKESMTISPKTIPGNPVSPPLCSPPPMPSSLHLPQNTGEGRSLNAALAQYKLNNVSRTSTATSGMSRKHRPEPIAVPFSGGERAGDGSRTAGAPPSQATVEDGEKTAKPQKFVVKRGAGGGGPRGGGGNRNTTWSLFFDEKKK
ncbi:MAG: hypothetical protein Q9227_003942 [Pyrenula ochraceoflavens]